MIIRLRRVKAGWKVRVEVDGKSRTLSRVWESAAEARIAGCAHRAAWLRRVVMAVATMVVTWATAFATCRAIRRNLTLIGFPVDTLPDSCKSLVIGTGTPARAASDTNPSEELTMTNEQQECRRAIKEVHYRRMEAQAIATGFRPNASNEHNVRGAIRAWVQDLTLAHPRGTLSWSLGNLSDMITVGNVTGARETLKDARGLRATLHALP